MAPFRSRRRTGFTLIELLVVVVVLGILASITIIKVNATRYRAGRAAVKSDLRNLAVAQESFFASNNAYSKDADSLQFRNTTGVTVDIVEASKTGWSATGTRDGIKKCTYFYGTAAPPAATSKVPDAIECE